MVSLAHAPADPAVNAMIGTVVAKRYRIDSLLGLGGMGAVFRAHHLLLRRDVAIKILRPHLSQKRIVAKRFEREAQSVARLEHPNIVRVSEFGSTEDGLRYLVMQLLQGKELHHYMGAPIPPRLALERAQQILAGLAHAHDHGVIHRDLKPENVYVTRNHRDQEVLKLVDFGVAKMINRDDETSDDPKQRDLTRAGLIFGTPKYMSPEQATGSKVDPRSDQYAVGVILYEMLTGRAPLNHEDPVCLIRMQVSVDPPPLTDVFPPPIRDYVHRLLEKNRDKRFASTQDALAALATIVPTIPANTPAGPALSAQMRRDWIENTHSGRELLSSFDSSDSEPLSSDSLQPTRHLSWHEGRNRTRGLSVYLPELPRWAWWSAAAAAIVLGLGIGAIVPALRGERGGQSVDASFRGLGAHRGPGPSAEQLAQIDRELLAGELERARQLLAPLRKAYPKDAQLIWRSAKAVSMHAKYRERKLSLYGKALEAEAKLIGNQEFYREIYDLLTHARTKRSHAIDFALQYLGGGGHPFLLGLINEPLDKNRIALGYTERQKILSALRKHPESARRVNEPLNLHRNLLQSAEQKQPCTVFLKSLDEIEAHPNAYFLNPLHKISAPTPKTATDDPEQAQRCRKAQDQLERLQAQFELKFGDREGTALPDRPVAPPPTGDADRRKKPASAKATAKKDRRANRRNRKRPKNRRN